MSVLGILSDITSLLAGDLPEDKWLQGFPGLPEARISGTLTNTRDPSAEQQPQAHPSQPKPPASVSSCLTSGPS